jgi:signal transduction histidine kinase
MSVRTARRISLVLRIGAGLMLVATLWLTILDRSLYGPGDLVFMVPVVIAMVTYLVVGTVLAGHQPRNWIGWAFLVVGTSLPAGFLAEEYAAHALVVAPGSLPDAHWAAWLGNWLFLVPISQVTLTLLLFPDGRLPTRRWRIVAWGLVVGMTGALISTMLRPADIEIQNGITVPNVAAIGSDAFWGPVAASAGILAVVSSILTAVSLFVRYRRSRGEERQQIRWLAYVGMLTVLFFFLAFAGNVGVASNESTTIGDLTWLLFIVSLALGIPAATAVALLKYRLYDLDLVVKKTAVFTIVALFLTGLYLLGLGLAALSGLGAIFAAILFVLTFNLVRHRARKLADRLVYGKRATPFEVLSEFSERVGETYSVDEVLPRMAQLLAASTGAFETRVWLRRDRRLTQVAAWPAELPIAADLPVTGDELPPTVEAAFPVRHQGDLLGAITLHLPANDPMDAQKERLVAGLASQAGLALRNVSLFEDLRASRRRIVSATDEERRRIERNIHDGAQQQLVALSVQLKLARTVVAGGDVEKAEPLLDRLQSAAATALEDLRDLARGIYPPLLADQGLAAALESQARRAALPVTVHADGVGRYPQDVEAAVYFCSLEALNNVAKYARASAAEVRLAQEDGHLAFSVRDDGAGFDPAVTGYGTGLHGMADRLDAIGGDLEIDSAPGRGTVVRGRVPVDAEEGAS